MRLLVPLTAIAMLLGTAVAHPQPYDPDDRGMPQDLATPLDDSAPPRRMVCFVDPPIPFVYRTCPTYPDFPGSPCRCSGSFFEGVRDYVD